MSQPEFSNDDVTIYKSKNWVFGAATHQGVVREINEDNWRCFPKHSIAMIADGMGGHEAGDVASRALCKSLENAPLVADLNERLDWIEDRVAIVHQDLRNYARDHHNDRTVGSTLVVWVEAGELGSVLWAGDSRLYRLRDQVLEPMTRDHSLMNEMLDRGLISEEAASEGKGGNVITRAVGAREQIHLDLKLFEIKSQDRFLLCSDGLYNAIAELQIAKLLSKPYSMEVKCQKIMAQALQAGARDNVTFILIEPLESLSYAPQ